MKIEMLEVVRNLYEQDKKKIELVFHPLEQQYYVLKTMKAPFNRPVYDALKADPHPGFAKVYEVKVQEDVMYVLEEFVNGPTLEYTMDAHTISKEEAVTYILEMLDVLEHLHALTPPIIHRDIKPANILVTNGHVKLIDFDIARKYDEQQRKDTVVMGSVGYAAPEQFGFSQSDPRTDIYAMGILMNELFCGHHPIEQQLDGKLGNVAATCMHIDPEQRYRHISDLRSAFIRALGIHEEKKKTTYVRKSYYGRLAFDAFVIAFTAYEYTAVFKEAGTAKAFYDAGTLALTFFSIRWIVTNVGGIRDITKFNKSRNPVLRFFNGFVIWFLCLLLIIIIMNFLYSLLSSMLQAYQLPSRIM